MREYKFRGKRIDNGEWVYGNYLKRYDSVGELHVIEVQCEGCFYIDSYEVIPETVGQWSGMKDKNGIEIYEGDIISDESGFSAPVVWYQDHCQFLVDYEAEPQELGAWCTVIGNIYDNPELNAADATVSTAHMLDPREPQEQPATSADQLPDNEEGTTEG